MKKKVIVLGGLGNGTVIANAIADSNKRGYQEWEFIGYLNDRIEINSHIEEYPVLGNLSDIRKFIDNNYYFINTILRIDGQQARIDLIENLNIPEEKMAVFTHPSAYIAPNVKLAGGTVIMPNVSVSSGASLGKGCLVMVGATVGHNTTMGKYCHLAAQSCLGANNVIGDGVHIGLNATTRENLHIGNYATLGMGSVLTKNIGENEIWIGNPAKFLRMSEL